MSAKGFALVVVAALVLGGATAIAGPDALRKAVTKSQVKKISAKQANARIQALAPTLSVAEAGRAGTADSAAEATRADDADELGGQPPSAYAASASEPFREVGTVGRPPFENGWDNFDPNSSSRASFYRDSLGVVHLRGTVDTAAPGNSAPIFTLPAGYRPATPYIVPIAPLSVGTTARLTVTEGGSVNAWCMESAGCSTSIDGAAFRAGS